MRYARKLGLAGVPGAILEQGDIRRAASFFAEEDRKAAGSMALGSLPATSSEAACATCAPTGSAAPRLSDRIASKMFREMGATPLASVAVDGKESPLMARAGALAAGIAESLKLRTDKIAVLSSLTSPMFAKAVDRTTLKLHGLKGNDRFASALTLGFLMGATDDHARRPTFYADAYRKAVQGMTDALSAVSDPALRPMAQKVIATLGTTARQQTPRQLAGLGAPVKWAAPNMAPLDTMVSSGILSRGEAAGYTNLIKSTTEWRYAVASADPRDIGTATRSPASLRVVDTYGALGLLWDLLVLPVQSTSPAWSAQPKAFGNDAKAALAWSQKQADAILAAKASSQPASDYRSKPTSADKYAALTSETSNRVNDAGLIAAWLIRNYGARVMNYANAGIGTMEWSKFDDVPYFPILPNRPRYESSAPKGARWKGEVSNQNQTNTGLWTTTNTLGITQFRGVTSSEFGRQCMIAYYAGIEQTKQHLLDYLANSRTSFPVVIGYALALARRDALERTGQIGSYSGSGGFEWVPNPDGEEQIPQGTQAYADWFANAGPSNDKPRWDAVIFAGDVYRRFYKREPTRHALGWYGRMGYGLGGVFSPDDFVKFENAITGKGIRPASDLPRTPEDERLAGAELPAESAKDRSSWFAIFGDKVSAVASNVLGVMSKGLDVATDLLCKVFKWLFGESAGGVLCSVINAILKYMVGAIMGATAALFAIVKAISLFINELMKGEQIKAFKVLILGINQAIFFVIGGPWAAVIGGNEMPFLKSQEKELREKAKAAGRDPNDVLPSLETLAEAMTSENPFFIFDVIFAVIDIATSAGALILKAAGRLVYALCPVMGYVFGGKALKAIKESKDPDVNQWKKLTLKQVQTAITAITKLIAAVVMGIIVATEAIKMLKDPWKRYVARKGGTASAIMSATGNVARRIDSELLVFFASFTLAAENGFQKSDPAFILMKEVLKSMWEKVPQILIGFITDELLTEDERKKFQPVIDAIADTVEQAKKAYETAKDILFPSAEYDPVPDPLPKDPEKRKEELKKREDGSKAVLPILALAAGLVVGFMMFGDSDGA